MTVEEMGAVEAKLAELYAKHGTLTPAIVLRVAKNENSPLHDYFEWDDSVAGQKWREEQARGLIRSVRVEITTDTQTVSVVKYQRDPNAEPEAQGYIETVALMGDKRASRAALTYECDRILALMHRTREIALVLGLLPEMEAALASVKHLRDRTAA